MKTPKDIKEYQRKWYLKNRDRILAKQSREYKTEKEQLVECVNNFQSPVAKFSGVSLKQRRLKAKHEKMAEEIIKRAGFEPDVPDVI